MTPRQQAMAFLAAYDRPDAHADERHIVRIAKSWLRMMGAEQSVQGMVDRIMDDFANTPDADYGCGWSDLREKFTAWAVTEEWLAPDAVPPA